MIKEQINITCGDGAYENCTLIVPSQVLTSTPQEETLDLEKSPNFQIVVPAAYMDKGIYEVTFSVGGNDYTANMIVVNNGSVNCTLQYVDGLTVEEVTHTFECAASEITTSYDLISGNDEVGVTHFLYDGTPVPAADISFGQMNYHNITVGEPTSNDITLTPKSFAEMTTGEFVDTLTATYKGMTATVNVTLTITQEESTPSFTYDGSDENSPIQVNVDLANYPNGEFDSEPMPEVNININYPSDAQYYWISPLSWGNYQELNSNNNNDCTLLYNSDQFWGVWTLGDAAYGYTGPRSAGTYLRSYSVTFTYISGLSGITDETTGDQIDDPVAQALDGTVITFWVQYNVTGAIPQPE